MVTVSAGAGLLLQSKPQPLRFISRRPKKQPRDVGNLPNVSPPGQWTQDSFSLLPNHKRMASHG